MQHGQRGNRRGEITLRADPASVRYRKTLKKTGKKLARVGAEVVQRFIEEYVKNFEAHIHEGEECVFYKHLKGEDFVGEEDVQLAVHSGRGRYPSEGHRKHPRAMDQVVSRPAQHQFPQPRSGSHPTAQGLASMHGIGSCTLGDQDGGRSSVHSEQGSGWSGRIPDRNC